MDIRFNTIHASKGYFYYFYKTVVELSHRSYDDVDYIVVSWLNMDLGLSQEPQLMSGDCILVKYKLL